jgi:hypothetical protein
VSWSDEAVPLLRTLVGDYSSAVYTDETLESVLIVAAYQVYQEVDTSHTYVISIASQTIVPDPTETDPPDEAFLNLFTIKAACLIDRGGAVASAREALKVVSHKHSFDTTAQAKFRLDILNKGWCVAYDEAKRDFNNTRTGIFGAAVLTPFRLYYNAYGRNNYGCFRDQQTG